MLSSKNDAKNESRFAARIDVLTERVDTLASTVATTASAMAKKEGEIAALRKELAVRDEQLAAYVTKAREAGAGGEELRELKQAVAALAAEQPSKRGSSKQLDEVTAKLNLLSQRLDTLSTTVSTTAAGLAGREGEIAAIKKQLESGVPAGAPGSGAIDPELRNQLANAAALATRLEARLDEQTAQLAALEARLAERETTPAPASDELRSMLAMLRTRVESLDALRGGVTEEVLDERLAASTAGITALAERVESLDALRAGVTEEVLEERLAAATEGIAALGERVDALAASVATATAGLAEKERELAALQETFLDSGTRIETIVVDLREALRALEEADPEAITALTARVEAALGDVASVAERVERLESAPGKDDRVEKLAERLEAVDRRLESVAGEIARAKTLWPVALRSLEARLDDAVAHKAAAGPAVDAEPGTTEQSQPAADGEGDLLAELRDSLQVMESVAAEIERAADGLSAADAVESMDDDEQQAVAGGARIVPLRASDP